MVTTRSQSSRNFQTENINMDRTSDNESEASFPDILSREQMTELDSNNLLNDRNNIEKNMIDQRFYKMNRQIGELTDLVLALTKQISSNHREGNELNMAKSSANSRSDTCMQPCNILTVSAVSTRVMVAQVKLKLDTYTSENCFRY